MGINILAAVYGTTTAGNNVTTICQNLVDNGEDDIPVNNTTMGSDPDVGVVKSFGIVYSDPQLNNGNPIALGCLENATLDLMPTQASTSLQQSLAPTGSVQVMQAVYGTGSNGNDVTAICQAFVNQGNLVIPVNNAVMGPDPNSGVVKSFSILYSVSGTVFALACQENTNLTLITS